MKSVLISELMEACDGSKDELVVTRLLEYIEIDRKLGHKQTAKKQREQNKLLLEAGRKALGLEK